MKKEKKKKDVEIRKRTDYSTNYSILSIIYLLKSSTS